MPRRKRKSKFSPRTHQTQGGQRSQSIIRCMRSERGIREHEKREKANYRNITGLFHATPFRSRGEKKKGGDFMQGHFISEPIKRKTQMICPTSTASQGSLDGNQGLLLPTRYPLIHGHKGRQQPTMIGESSSNCCFNFDYPSNCAKHRLKNIHQDFQFILPLIKIPFPEFNANI